MDKPVIRVKFSELRSAIEEILHRNGFSSDRARSLAHIFAENNLYGKESHGINRFPAFIESVKKGYVKPDANPVWLKSVRSIEQWDGKFGPGPLNAVHCTDRAMELAKEYGIGCVTLKNTNHWMRGGTYGWRAAEKGYILICWSNTKPNMPAWGSSEARLGNNPLVIAVPGKKSPVVLDMAMSQYSYGSLEVQSRKKKTQLPYEGGYDKEGNLTTNPNDILDSNRPLPAGLWKGAGLALVLDLVAVLLSDGRSTSDIGKDQEEFGLSQVFIAINPELSGDKTKSNQTVRRILADFHRSVPTDGNKVFYPGEKALLTRRKYRKEGIPVDKKTWENLKMIKEKN